MNNDYRYILIGDDCEHCKYIANVFTFLQLPLFKMSYLNLLESSEELTETSALLLCKEVEKSHYAQIYPKIKSDLVQVISFLPVSLNKVCTASFHRLPLSFSETDIKSVLVQCQQQVDVGTESEIIFERLLGRSAPIRQVRRMIKQVADSDSTVLILGESGTGKEVVASCIHYYSARKNNPLVPINCGAIPSELMESELFGHEKGAFTGALTRRVGRFEIANHGTLFLDEIGDMPLPMQVKLLRVIQDRLIERVGGNASIKIDVRLIAATNKNLRELIDEKRFREDLFYRLNVFPIHVPRLAERHEDIPDLINFHLNRIYARLKHRVIFTERATEILVSYSWPGNIRELENFLERMVILHPDSVIDEKDIESAYAVKNSTIRNLSTAPAIDNPLNFKDYITDVERQVIAFALKKSNGVINATADYLSMGRKALMDKMKKYNLTDETTE